MIHGMDEPALKPVHRSAAPEGMEQYACLATARSESPPNPTSPALPINWSGKSPSRQGLSFMLLQCLYESDDEADSGVGVGDENPEWQTPVEQTAVASSVYTESDLVHNRRSSSTSSSRSSESGGYGSLPSSSAAVWSPTRKMVVCGMFKMHSKLW